MGVCCVSHSMDPKSMIDMSNIDQSKLMNKNQNINNNKEENNKLESNKNLIKENPKKENLNENKNPSNNIINNENKVEIIEGKKEKQIDKNINNDNSPVNAEKQTNNNSHLSNNTMSKKNSQNLKKEIVKKKKNKNEINIVFLGDTNTGKSCFVIKFVENIFEKIYIPTLGSEIKKKIVSYNTHKYQLNFIVTSGNDYKDDYTDFYNNADFFLVFYDITIQKSFDNVKEIIQKEILPYLYIYKDGVSNIILIGNKIDIENERKVKIEDVENYCKENKFIFFEISIKTNKNINQMMNTLLKSFDQISYPE